MDIYGMSSSSSSGQDFSAVDELLDFSIHDFPPTTTTNNDVILHQHSSSTAPIHINTIDHNHHHNNNNNNHNVPTTYNHHHQSTDFTDHLCLPNEDVAELEWLSNFVHDSFSNFPANNISGTINYRTPENTSSFHGNRSRTKRTKAPTNSTTWTSTAPPIKLETYSSSPTSSSSETTSDNGVVRRCTHCSSEKTPQWRTGPLGPKTLCNACGVRYKSGRLVPEYRPAASPTFVLTQHSNSHRKVMELRRQKEMMIGQPQQSTSSEYQMYHQHRHNRNNYEVC
uniref:GATA transcription factor 4 n=1 Tax=Erigeron canadensis TaxID=72917 RepID=UPI001CB9227B|nr:GATA transcription factor 4 [Erigeron canadensis]